MTNFIAAAAAAVVTVVVYFYFELALLITVSAHSRTPHRNIHARMHFTSFFHVTEQRLCDYKMELSQINFSENSKKRVDLVFRY